MNALLSITVSWDIFIFIKETHVLEQRFAPCFKAMAHFVYFKQNMFSGRRIETSACLCCGPSSGARSYFSVLVRVPPDESVCPCPKIPLVNLTETPQTDCFHVGARFRYACKAGYVREAGTSNLIRCVQRDERAEWTKPNLACKSKLYVYFHHLIASWSCFCGCCYCC